MRGLAAVLSLALLCPLSAAAQLTSQVYVSGLSSPVAFIQDPTLADTQYVVQQGGRIRAIQNGQILANDFLDLRNSGITTGGEQGLLGLAFAPDYATSGRLFVNFTNSSGHTVIARFRRSTADPRRADIATRFDFLWPGNTRWIPQPYSNHNAGDLKFGPDGYLYIPLGDGGSANDPEHRAQNPATLLGKMLRINVNVPDTDAEGYDIPAGNPFIGQGGYLPEIWSFGWRNPFRFSFDSFGSGATGAIIVGDVGQGAFEEIDYEPANRPGRNYGWCIREGFQTNSACSSRSAAYAPLTDPIHAYGRSVGQTVIGGFVYRGTALPSTYRGRYFFADYATPRVFSLTLSIGGTGEATVTAVTEHTSELGGGSALGNMSAFGIDSNGELYIVSHSRGEIRRVISAAPASQLAMALDAPTAGTISPPFAMAGWAIDRAQTDGSTGVDTVHFYAFPTAGGAGTFLGATYGVSRPDVAAIFGSNYQNSGFALSVSGLPAGSYLLVAYAHSSVTGQFEGSASVSVTIAAGTAMSIDAPSANAAVAARFNISGWAIDRDSTSGTGVDTVHVWAYPVSGSPRFIGAATYGGSRPDVGATFGTRFTNSGWALAARGLPAGTWTLVASLHSTTTGTFRQSAVVTVQVQSGAIVQVDIPSGPSATRPFQIVGWGVDLAALSGAGISAIHAYAFPVGGGSAIFIGAGTLGQNRSDIGAIFGSQFTPSGYQLTWPTSLPAGTYDLVVYAQSAVSGTFDALKVLRLTVN